MNRKLYLKKLKKIKDDAVKIIDIKSRDYAKEDDPFYNFRLCETLRICSLETGILVRMCDKMARCSGLLKGRQGAVKDESIADTLVDMSNYSDIMNLYLREKADERLKRSKRAKRRRQGISEVHGRRGSRKGNHTDKGA